MTNYKSGHDAERDAAKYLKKLRFKILDLNWKTRYCEIDIVTQKQNVIWFIEVKSRKNNSQGFGYEYITQKKLQQMQFAAEMWIQENNWNGEYQLGVVSIDAGQVSFIDELS